MEFGFKFIKPIEVLEIIYAASGKGEFVNDSRLQFLAQPCTAIKKLTHRALARLQYSSPLLGKFQDYNEKSQYIVVNLYISAFDFKTMNA